MARSKHSILHSRKNSGGLMMMLSWHLMEHGPLWVKSSSIVPFWKVLCICVCSSSCSIHRASSCKCEPWNQLALSCHTSPSLQFLRCLDAIFDAHYLLKYLQCVASFDVQLLDHIFVQIPVLRHVEPPQISRYTFDSEKHAQYIKRKF